MPRTRRQNGTTALPHPPPPPNDSQANRPALRPEDVCVGCIVWLPNKDTLHGPTIKCKKKKCGQNCEMEDGGYNHPVVVLKIKQKKSSSVLGDLVLTVACMTSFQNKTLKKYLASRKNAAYYQTSIPIRDPKNEDLETTGIKQLELDEGKNMNKKQSYVRMDHAFKVRVSTLKSLSFKRKECRAYKTRLNESSYLLLMEEMDILPDSYAKTDTLEKTAALRLALLAASRDPAGVPASHAPRPALQPTYHSRESYLNQLGASNSHTVPSTSTYAAVPANRLASIQRLPVPTSSIQTHPPSQYPSSSRYTTQPAAYGYQQGTAQAHGAYTNSTYMGYQQDAQPPRISRATYQPPSYTPYTRPTPPAEESGTSIWGYFLGFVEFASFGWWRYSSN